MPAFQPVTTPRLLLRRPVAADAEAIFSRYASDPELTRYMAWPRHRTLDDTREFIAFSDEAWQTWPAGPLLIERREDHLLLGGTGFGFNAPDSANTGYILARDAAGHGYATEAITAIVSLAWRFGIRRLDAICYASHQPSIHVLEKCGFLREELLRNAISFPNLAPGFHDAVVYSIVPAPLN